MSKLNNKKKAYRFISEINNDDNTLSVTLTGSYSENFNEKTAGDIDIIIICKKFNKTFYKKCIDKIKILKKKYFDKKNKLIINSTFGPIKFYKEDTTVFHLMIYDLQSHIDHTIKSPFTCYDWERSNIYVGKSLKELSPVYKLQLKDFYKARRNTQEYLDDILKNQISYREYNFTKNKISLKKKYFKLDKINQRDFIYHTIKFLLVNYIKYEKNINLLVENSEIDKKFEEITNNKTHLFKFQRLRLLKSKKSNDKLKGSNNLALSFIRKFDRYIKEKDQTYKKIFFSRHKKTTINGAIFLGQRLNPNIIEKKTKQEFKKIKIDKCFSSPSVRCIETAKIICKRTKIYTDNNLKEINYGNAEGLNLNQLNKKYPNMTKNWKNGKDPKFPNGESTNDALTRLNTFIKKKLKKNINGLDKSILVLSHNVILRCLIGKSFNIKMNEWFKISIEYFDLLEFRLIKGKLVSNIDRIKFLSIFKNFIKDKKNV